MPGMLTREALVCAALRLAGAGITIFKALMHSVLPEKSVPGSLQRWEAAHASWPMLVADKRGAVTKCRRSQGFGGEMLVQAGIRRRGGRLFGNAMW
jgi:hypothetical protein